VENTKSSTTLGIKLARTALDENFGGLIKVLIVIAILLFWE